MQKKRWKILPYNEEKTTQLHKELKISKSICNILVQRSIETYDTAKKYFRPDINMIHSPWLMKDMDKAVAAVEECFIKKNKILIFGDYDVDGTAAVALMYDFLSRIFPENLIDFYIPHRYREGYGVSKVGIDFAADNGFSLIICLDCGIKSVELVQYAKTKNIDFIICDHHLPGIDLPNAIAILNPKQNNCEYPYKELCGCGIGFKFISALAQKFKLDASTAYEYLDLVAIAIAADIVPMTGENRIFAFFGLTKINDKPLVGISALIELAEAKYPLTINNLVFIIAPRINAAGRMDDAKKAVQLFIEKIKEKALKFAEMLHDDNTERKLADKNTTESALDLLMSNPNIHSKKSSVVYNPNWHKGVVGIVASRLIETYYRPTVVLTKSGDFAVGSARSVAGFNLYEAIYQCKSLLTAYGGHFAAAGLSMPIENVNEFAEKFEEIVSQNIEKDSLIPQIIIDSEINFNEINDKFFSIIQQMEPFGPENMRPTFITKNVLNSGYSKIVKESHIRFVLTQSAITITGIGFNLAEKFDIVASNNPFDIVYNIEENEWNGNKSLQLKVIDIRHAE